MSSLEELAVSRKYPARQIELQHPEGPLVLRPTLMQDAERICRDVELSVEALRAFMPWSHAPQTPLSQLERLRANEAAYYSGSEMVMGLFRGETMLAMVGLHPRVPLNPTALEVGYWAPTAQSGKGWTTLGVQIAILYAFDKLAAERVQVMCDEANMASRRVIEKAGFCFEGTLLNVVQSVPPELVQNGYAGTPRHLMFGLVPEQLAGLPWAAPLRARLRYQNLAGYWLGG